jgi:uncharacterized membrane protein YjgN (DUF898 family)
MKEFFAGLYEWWGLNPFYATDLADHLRGYDITCTDYVATPWYSFIGFSMLISTLFLYAIQYHIIDSTRFNKTIHWWIMALVIVILNFLIAFSIPFNSLQTEDYCSELFFNFSDCLGFGISNAIWSLVVFILITSAPWIRGRSINCRHTTLWKR